MWAADSRHILAFSDMDVRGPSATARRAPRRPVLKSAMPATAGTAGGRGGGGRAPLGRFARRCGPSQPASSVCSKPRAGAVSEVRRPRARRLQAGRQAIMGPALTTREPGARAQTSAPAQRQAWPSEPMRTAALTLWRSRSAASAPTALLWWTARRGLSYAYVAAGAASGCQNAQVRRR